MKSSWNIEEETGYVPQTNLWEVFTMVDFTESADIIREIFTRVFDESKSSVVVLTELSLVLNHKIWQWYKRNDNIAKAYDELWRKVDDYAMDNLEDENLSYYIRTTD